AIRILPPRSTLSGLPMTKCCCQSAKEQPSDDFFGMRTVGPVTQCITQGKTGFSPFLDMRLSFLKPIKGTKIFLLLYCSSRPPRMFYGLCASMDLSGLQYLRWK